METKANYILVGVFTLAVIAAAFGFVYWFSRTGEGGEQVTYRAVFEGSVSGLRTGGSVLFNGIKVGDVAGLRLDDADPRKVIATLRVDKTVPVRADTKVGLDYQGLTGIASVSLKGGDRTAPELPRPKGEAPVLYAEPSATQDLAQGARELMNRADSVVRRIDTILADNEAPLKTTIRNVETFTNSLAQNTERFDKILANLDRLTGPDSQAAVAEIKDAAKSMRTLADNLDKRTAELAAGLNRFTGSGLREFEAFAVEGRRTLVDIQKAVRNFDRNPQRLIFGGSNTVPEYNSRR